MDFRGPGPDDEGRHPPGDEQYWNESWYFDVSSVDGTSGGYVRIGLYPNLDAVWYWACMVEEGGRLVMAVDHGLALPGSDRSLEVRGSALWADHVCEEPFQRWSLGLETHALALDDPREAYADEPRGDLVPFGFELEWETAGAPFAYAVTPRYEIPCRVHGEFRLGDTTVPVDAPGQRDHSWGVRDWWQFGWVWSSAHLSDGTHLHGTEVRLAPEAVFSTGYVQDRNGPRESDRFSVTENPTGDGLVADATFEMVVGDEVLAGTIEPTGWAPVLCTSTEGKRSYFARALSRWRLDDGRSGVGWVEFNMPQS